MTLRACALAALTAALAGCPGSIDNPSRFFDAARTLDASPSRDVALGDGADASTPDDRTPTDATTPDDRGGGDAGPSCVEYVERTLIPGTCATTYCHDAVEPAANLDLASPNLRMRLVGVRGSIDCRRVMLIDPAHPEQSLTVVKVSARPGCGSRMPLGDDALDDGQQACVLAWAAAVASGDAGSGP